MSFCFLLFECSVSVTLTELFHRASADDELLVCGTVLLWINALQPHEFLICNLYVLPVGVFSNTQCHGLHVAELCFYGGYGASAFVGSLSLVDNQLVMT